ncbi:6,7-dimethyl-8-ribityllumazine synthase [Agrilactobacillus composti DSM 18527 = JCM 14202]|uniref:6,7-dimethyl-8-ribityllumazine synthase n=1 Tax=Agrilactobacillus composti DSM 18527 = JCM 14202 TaxID=1423734 RepID=X0PUG4_9LACO|nr:6,7-dimethyl-8-ribityllumazine synthase [Agrilactobacillus composti]KRM30871.1 6,7-dimethyl-8-ribityllumazine synthase [Agrilactobacillus composti DSM 18527 = JCM 14202]GAF41747.1 6,7-dimethyl-8-ribityllumazine synthase [Agrilactobacillus composti DSM 18527 = JCM 14202]
MPTFQGPKNGADQRIGIVVAQFNELVTERLKAGALAELQQLGVSADNITVISVPGAFELPRAAQQMSLSGRFDGIIALGAVIRGETDHYQYVCSQTAGGLAAVSLNGPIPVMFGVLTTDTLDQAINRAGGKVGNKGRDCAAGVLEMIGLTKLLKA